MPTEPHGSYGSSTVTADARAAELPATTFPPTGWERRYRHWVLASDACLTLVVILGGSLLFGAPGMDLLLALGTAVAVGSALPAVRAWQQRVLGNGAEEFRRLGKGFLLAAVLVALCGLIAGELAVRPWVFGVLPAAAVSVIAGRYVLRKRLHRARRQGRCLLPLMAAGSQDAVRELIQRTRDQAHVGWQVEAVCTIDGTGQDGARGDIDGVPVVGDLSEIANHVRRGGYRMVAVTADAYWTPARLQELAWSLEDTTAEMAVAPMLMEVAGPRLQVSGVLGMPLLHVSAPTLTGGRRVVKGVVDRIGAALLLALLSPALLAIAAAIRVGDGGPAIYRQQRVGKNGKTFTMLKFRTMVPNADAVLAGLTERNEGAGPLFKMRRDPRITRVGAFLRRYSLDELPQLLNVVSGSMSLVGPRPPLPAETAAYRPHVRRRLLVKPGLTGLWQVSGRSDLSWDESVRLDLRYVEDWSLALDAMILWKTVRAVASGAGAY
ncbi:exopolysaccharide biosynthesis polyprenyl glycosylphosphotransferase [Tamaricihabitans halophyticus]|uniref:Exopolysaccharide biosynthesis polyprenyl glycosylphosphotransferase n=1 Tax=Tamaricihabitans halophyticus TaxID=1262583 RepID=A0A4R2R1W7_9PSEU|nr:sugar transferase [Tamaricihabitans halophyticus]TCP56503.1 exopolysaccharide biosynthesis polyprenyl glycosylphosphotransferase [Tamaricihabitans halophyticus]